MATVLIIEDDPIILENTIELLQFEDFTVFGAVDGVQGVEQALKYLPDVILCDVMMPKLDGFGVLRELRANPSTAAIPLVFVSATPCDDIIAVSSTLGVSDYLLKPFQSADLIRVIRKSLSSHPTSS